jgi:hypothetical protein
MDLLDRVLGPASDLLTRVDDSLLRHGAPPGHPVWTALQRVGALPSAAVAHVASLDPVGIRAGAHPIQPLSGRVRQEIAAGPVALDSRGVGPDRFMARWTDLSAQVAGDNRPGRGSFTDRLDATVTLLEDVADWATTARRDLAGELGACLGSAEAVQVRSASGGPTRESAQAAADIAERVLDAVGRGLDDGWQVYARWTGIDERIPMTATVFDDGFDPTHIELH